MFHKMVDTKQGKPSHAHMGTNNLLAGRTLNSVSADRFYQKKNVRRLIFSLFRFKVAFNNLSVISRRSLDVKGAQWSLLECCLTEYHAPDTWRNIPASHFILTPGRPFPFPLGGSKRAASTSLTHLCRVDSSTSQKGKRKVHGVPQSQNAALPRPQEEEETDKVKQAQTEQTYEKH